MLENKIHNSYCNYSEQLISFLYNEIENSDKLKFEAHLLNCSSCADEISGFSSLRTSIQDWRHADFEILAPPSIEITKTHNPGVSSDSSSRLEKIRVFFGLYKGWISAGAFAALLIFSGFIWFGANSLNNNELTQYNGNKEIEKTITMPAVEKQNNDLPVSAISEKEIVSGDTTEKFSNTSNRKNLKPSSLQTTKSVSRKGSKGITSETAIVAKKSASLTSNRYGQIARKSVNKNKVPSISTDEYEDNSLRLADILDDVSMK